jgi:ATP-dependent RNA helicase DDX56/DBP9
MSDARLVDQSVSFSSFSHLLDARLLRALADLGFARPTLVQAKAIPLALDSRDILARARTGSGKTAAYAIPLVQKILGAKAVGAFPAARATGRMGLIRLVGRVWRAMTRRGRQQGRWCLYRRRS